MSSERFEDYEEEFRTTYESLQNVAKNKLTRLSGGKDEPFCMKIFLYEVRKGEGQKVRKLG